MEVYMTIFIHAKKDNFQKGQLKFKEMLRSMRRKSQFRKQFPPLGTPYNSCQNKLTSVFFGGIGGVGQMTLNFIWLKVMGGVQNTPAHCQMAE